MTDDVAIRLLGPVRLGSDGRTPGGPKLRLLLAGLALQPREVVSVDRLTAVLWQRDLPDDPQHALQAQVSKLRRALTEEGVAASIEHRDGGYVLDVAPEHVDAHRFDQEVATGLHLVETAPTRAREVLDGALGLWRARPTFTDHPELRVDAARLADLHLRACEARVGLDVTVGQHASAIAAARALLSEHPLRESLWRHLMLAAYRAGRQAEALAAYDEARSLLADELGIDPSPALQRLHTQILQQDPVLDGDGDHDTLRRPAAPARSLAILPFEVIGASADAQHLALGLHSDLLSELSRVPELTVISRTSAVAVRGTDRAIPDIARELGVGAVVEGTVQSSGHRVRLRVQLVDARRDVQLWSHAYDGELTPDNLFGIQSELARDLAGALSTELAPQPAGDATTRTDDLAAYRLAAVGRQHLDRKTAEGHQRAIEAFEGAARRDPDYVEVWTGLGDALVSMEAYGHGDPHELLPAAQRAVHRAIALEPLSASARASLGVLHIAYQDGPAAVGELEHAIRIQPGHAPAHNWLTWVTLLLGRTEQALPTAGRALELDPLAAEAHAHMALAMLADGRPQEALRSARRAREHSPYTTADLYEGLCLHELGRHEEACGVLAPLSLRERGQPGAPWAGCGPDATLAQSLAALGEEATAREVLADIHGAGDHFAAGLVHGALGELEQAAASLDRVQRVGAWPALLVHHAHRELWGRMGGTYDTLQAVVRRSWSGGTR